MKTNATTSKFGILLILTFFAPCHCMDLTMGGSLVSDKATISEADMFRKVRDWLTDIEVNGVPQDCVGITQVILNYF